MMHDPIVLLMILLIVLALSVFWMIWSTQTSKDRAARREAAQRAEQDRLQADLTRKYAARKSDRMELGYHRLNPTDFTGSEPLSQIRLNAIKQEILKS